MGKKIPIRYFDSLSKGDLGRFEVYPTEIHIVDDDHWREHLLHEVLHAILFLSGHSEQLDQKLEEAIVRAIEHGLLGIRGWKI